MLKGVPTVHTLASKKKRILTERYWMDCARMWVGSNLKNVWGRALMNRLGERLTRDSVFGSRWETFGRCECMIPLNKLDSRVPQRAMCRETAALTACPYDNDHVCHSILMSGVHILPVHLPLCNLMLSLEACGAHSWKTSSSECSFEFNPLLSSSCFPFALSDALSSRLYEGRVAAFREECGKNLCFNTNTSFPVHFTPGDAAVSWCSCLSIASRLRLNLCRTTLKAPA